MLWFSFMLGKNFVFFCMILSLKQRKIEFKPRIKLNHNWSFSNSFGQLDPPQYGHGSFCRVTNQIDDVQQGHINP